MPTEQVAAHLGLSTKTIDKYRNEIGFTNIVGYIRFKGLMLKNGLNKTIISGCYINSVTAQRYL
jgi:hypothetical protein